MELLDILARDLKVWPDNNLADYAASFVAQDSDGMLVTLDPEEHACTHQFNGRDWSRSNWTGGDSYLEVAEDHQTATVTREQWQAAVDALNSPQPSAIKSLEERIKDQAIEALASDVEDAMRHLLGVSGDDDKSPSGVGDMTIREVIDAAGAAIMKARSPKVADQALDRALQRLADQFGTSPFMTPGPSRK